MTTVIPAHGVTVEQIERHTLATNDWRAIALAVRPLSDCWAQPAVHNREFPNAAATEAWLIREGFSPAEIEGVIMMANHANWRRRWTMTPDAQANLGDKLPLMRDHGTDEGVVHWVALTDAETQQLRWESRDGRSVLTVYRLARSRYETPEWAVVLEVEIANGEPHRGPYREVFDQISKAVAL